MVVTFGSVPGPSSGTVTTIVWNLWFGGQRRAGLATAFLQVGVATAPIGSATATATAANAIAGTSRQTYFFMWLPSSTTGARRRLFRPGGSGAPPASRFRVGP